MAKIKGGLNHSATHNLKTWYGMSLRLIFEGQSLLKSTLKKRKEMNYIFGGSKKTKVMVICLLITVLFTVAGISGCNLVSKPIETATHNRPGFI